jgi:hypothetical protein
MAQQYNSMTGQIQLRLSKSPHILGHLVFIPTKPLQSAENRDISTYIAAYSNHL